MPPVPILAPSDVIKIFQRLGWQMVRQKGSHIIMTKPKEKTGTFCISDEVRTWTRAYASSVGHEHSNNVECPRFASPGIITTRFCPASKLCIPTRPARGAPARQTH